MLSRRTILLKPMQPAVSGYARLVNQNAQTVLQLTLRGLQAGEEVTVYLQRKPILSGRAGAHGDAAFTCPVSVTDMQEGEIIVTGGRDAPRPLLIGLCAEQSADRLTALKSAAIALCAKPAPKKEQPSPPVKPAAKPQPPVLPKEVFLPAIAPSPCAQTPAALKAPPPKRDAPPVDRLKPLQWPRGYESLAPYFENALPCRLFDRPGWRFVYAAHSGGPEGLWLGMQRQDGQVCGVAYAHRGRTPPNGRSGYQTATGTDGQPYQVLWQRIRKNGGLSN